MTIIRPYVRLGRGRGPATPPSGRGPTGCTAFRSPASLRPLWPLPCPLPGQSPPRAPRPSRAAYIACPTCRPPGPSPRPHPLPCPRQPHLVWHGVCGRPRQRCPLAVAGVGPRRAAAVAAAVHGCGGGEKEAGGEGEGGGKGAALRVTGSQRRAVVARALQRACDGGRRCHSKCVRRAEAPSPPPGHTFTCAPTAPRRAMQRRATHLAAPPPRGRAHPTGAACWAAAATHARRRRRRWR